MTTTMKIEVVFVPVSDIDRAKEFYVDKLGFHLDNDQSPSADIRFVQLTPPGSACSIAFGKGITDTAPGSLKNVMMVVEDVHALHTELSDRGVEISDLDKQPWGTFAYITDPDGNGWTFQELPDYSQTN